MGEVARGGRTVLFVSHNMGAVENICKNAILFQKGRIYSRGTAQEIVEQYIESVMAGAISHIVVLKRDDEYNAWVDKAAIVVNGEISPVMKYGDSLGFDVQFSSNNALCQPSIGFVIASVQGEKIINSNNIYLQTSNVMRPAKKGTIRCSLGMIPVMEGRYLISLWFGENKSSRHQYLENILAFDVVEKDLWGSGNLPTRKISHLWWPTEFELKTDDQDG